MNVNRTVRRRSISRRGFTIIELLIVIDGLLPKLINEKQNNILSKSIELWNAAGSRNE